MIRSRDLVLFVIILLFLCGGVTYTLVKENDLSVQTTAPVDFETEDGISTSFTAVAPEEDENREGNIARLREALKDVEIVTVPESEIVMSVSDADKPADVISAEVFVLQSCSAAENMPVWPARDVSFEISNASRKVVHTSAQQTGTTSASSSVPQNQALISLPLYPYPSQKPMCVPSEAVGVTLAGSLILNSQVSLYRGYGPEYLIGYARDGYPIYGFYQGAVDSCGGYTADTGYRYTVSPDRNYIVGCFKATPSLFVDQ